MNKRENLHDKITLPFIASIAILAAFAIYYNNIKYYFYLGLYTFMFMIGEMIYYFLFMKMNMFNIIIIIHHIISCIMISWTIYHPSDGFFFALNLLVEFNTILLKLRHLLDRNGLLYKYVDKIFKISWFPLRLILFPINLYLMHKEMYDKPIINYYQICIPQSLLIVFYIYWTYDIFLKKNKKSKND